MTRTTPEKTSPAAGDQELRRLAVHVLDLGFRVSVLIMAVGLALALFRQEALPSTLEQPDEIARGIVQGQPEAVIGLGIMAIILTPFASTIAIAIAFYRQGDRRYAAIGVTVLLILLGSIGLSFF